MRNLKTYSETHKDELRVSGFYDGDLFDANGARFTRTGDELTPEQALESSTRVTRTVAPTESLDTPESVEQYRTRYPADRQDTFDAYVLVFFTSDARQFPGGWAQFARCASAEPERKETAPALVARAE